MLATNFRIALPATLLLLLLSACKSGSDGGSPGGNTPPPTPTPTPTPSPGNYSMFITKSGVGRVASTDISIDCGSTCNASYANGTLVQLTATPDPAYRFTGWTGGVNCGVVATCNVAMNAERRITAVFTLITSGNPDYTIPSAHPRILLNATRLAELQTRANNNTAAYALFKSSVDSARNGNVPYAFEAWNVALMRHVTGDVSHCTWAVQTVDTFVAAEEARIASNQNPAVAGDSYLEVGELIGNLAIVYDWCHANTSATQKQRWIAYANQAVWNVWNHNEAYWGNRSSPWTGWSVDNPVNNYYYSFLQATMLLGIATHNENPLATDWIVKFRVEKIQNHLVPVFSTDLIGGGSREGTGYGTAMRTLFWLYDVWEASTGERVADLVPHTRASGLYLIHAVTPTLDRLAPIGDHARDQTAALFDYHRAYALVLARLYPNDSVGRVLADFVNKSSVPRMSQQFQRWIDYVYDPSAITVKPLSDLYLVYHGQGTGHVFMRSGWTTDATWAHFTAGPYTESHAHRDQGQILLFKREWLALDANYFSTSGILQDEELHNLVRMNRNGTALRQREGYGPAYLYALTNDTDFTWTAGSLAPAYNPADGVQTLEREVLFIKPNLVVVFDRVSATPAVTADWLLNSPFAPVINGNTATFTGTQTTLVARRIHPATASAQVQSLPSINAEFTGGHRLTWSSASAPFLVVLSLDGTATNAVAADSTGMRGTTITLSDGRSIIVRFNETQRGGTIEFRNSSGGLIRQATLTPTVSNLPEFQVP